jgi:hypothetical protein
MSSAPHSTLPYPPIHTDKKFVALSDWCALRSFVMHIETGYRLGMARSLQEIPMIVRWLFA